MTVKTEKDETEVMVLGDETGQDKHDSLKFSSEIIQRVIGVKDEGCICDKSCHERKMVEGVRVPPLSQLKVEQKEMDGIIPLHEIEKCERGDGCRRSITDVIRYNLQRNTIKDGILHMKFGGDGARHAKKIES